VTSFKRSIQYASILLALSVPAFSQSPARLKVAANDAMDAPFSSSADATTLPDAPSALQQQTTTPAPPPQNETPEQKKAREAREEAEREVKEQEKQRIGGIIPNFNVRIDGQGVPLTPKEKFNISFHTIIDPYTIGLAVLVGGGLGELEDSHTGYHHGFEGLAKRVGSSYADNVSGNLIGNALLPSILHQDPRYFRKGTGSIISRVLFSASTAFICKGDNGHWQFNASNVLGNFASGGLSNVYYPSDERGFGLTVDNAITVTLEGMLGAQLLEFSPDVSSYIHKRKEHHRQVLLDQAKAAAAAQTPPTTPK